ncbi:hypothetical protein [Enterobacter cloacae]|uniref:hypothetical protein n=1 Tax=Enterobacter cloacae TaxID=550 RepID=UPI000E2E4E3B|nr:hypothetical protein [Enterobacter cloacae]
MCQNCKAKAAEMNAKFEEMEVADLVKMLGIVRGTEQSSAPERLITVVKFASIFDDPMEIIGLAHHLGVHYLAEKDRADKMQSTLNMVSEQKCAPSASKADATVASKDREIAGLKSSMAILISAFKLMTTQTGFKMPDLKSDDPMAVRQMLGSMADQLDSTKSRLEDMMRELTHRYDLNKQPQKDLSASH